jgi:hypothetical protein
MNAAPIILSRWSGLGDVAMALCAAHAYHALTGGAVYFRTAPAYRPLARACPHVAGVLETGEEAPAGARVVSVHDAAHGLDTIHEVDSFCRALGLSGVDPQFKTLDLDVERAEPGAEALVAGLLSPYKGRRWVALHPGRRDPNRTWPLEHWVSLAQQLFLFGLSVLLVGEGEDVFPIAGSIPAPPDGCFLLDLTNHLTVLETVAVLRHVQALVSTDGGPIQLAGASSAAIVGIYSVVSGSNRLPYRTGTGQARAVAPLCGHFPCYREASNPTIWAAESRMMADEGLADLNDILRNWCPAHPPLGSSDRFSCLRREIPPTRVLRAILEVI